MASLIWQPLPPLCGHVCLLPSIPNDYSYTEEELLRDMSHVIERDIWQESCLFRGVRGYYANQSINLECFVIGILAVALASMYYNHEY